MDSPGPKTCIIRPFPSIFAYPILYSALRRLHCALVWKDSFVFEEDSIVFGEDSIVFGEDSIVLEEDSIVLGEDYLVFKQEKYVRKICTPKDYEKNVFPYEIFGSEM